MKKFAAFLMIAALAVLMAVPVFACDKDKTACTGKAKTTTAQATNGDNSTVTPAVATSGDKSTVNMTGESCTGKATTSKTGASCSADKGSCCAKGSSASASAKLPNGHPSITVAEAMKCEGTMVAFLDVNKMHCENCVNTVKQTLSKFDGVCAVDVDLKKASAVVVFHPEKVKTDQLTEAVSKAGFTSNMKADCSEECKALFGNMTPEQCMKQCANMCKMKQETKKTSSES
jgi:copper chaperone CopZ